MLKILSLLIFCSSCCFAQAVRVRCERTEGDSVITSHGTAWVAKKDKLITCLHVVEKGDVFVETEDGWIRCSVEKVSKTDDLAMLRPRIKIPLQDDPKGCWCFGSPLGAPIRKMKTSVDSPVATVDGAAHGISGSPIMSDGNLIGIVTAILGDLTVYVSVAKVTEFLK